MGSDSSPGSSQSGGRLIREPTGPHKLLPLWEHPLADVFAAGDGRRKRALLLTFLRTGIGSDDEGKQHAMATAKALAELDCSFIFPIVEARLIRDGRLVLAGDLIEGTTLGQHMLDGPIEPARAIPILRQVCHALDAAHGAGMRHGALSVASIILTSDGDREDAVRVTDFGIEDAVTVEAMGDWEAEMQPLSPEKITGATPTAREDVYLLGAVAYAALSGNFPFPGEGQEVRDAHRDAAPAPLEVDLSLADVVMRCLAKDPNKRFATIRDVESALREAQEDLGITTPWDDLPACGQGKPKSSASASSSSLNAKIPSGPYEVVGAGPKTAQTVLSESSGAVNRQDLAPALDHDDTKDEDAAKAKPDDAASEADDAKAKPDDTEAKSDDAKADDAKDAKADKKSSLFSKPIPKLGLPKRPITGPQKAVGGKSVLPPPPSTGKPPGPKAGRAAALGLNIGRTKAKTEGAAPGKSVADSTTEIDVDEDAQTASASKLGRSTPPPPPPSTSGDDIPVTKAKGDEAKDDKAKDEGDAKAKAKDDAKAKAKDDAKAKPKDDAKAKPKDDAKAKDVAVVTPPKKAANDEGGGIPLWMWAVGLLLLIGVPIALMSGGDDEDKAKDKPKTAQKDTKGTKDAKAPPPTPPPAADDGAAAVASAGADAGADDGAAVDDGGADGAAIADDGAALDDGAAGDDAAADDGAVADDGAAGDDGALDDGAGDDAALDDGAGDDAALDDGAGDDGALDDGAGDDGGGDDGGSAPRKLSPAQRAAELVRSAKKAHAAGQVAKAESRYKLALSTYSRSHQAAAGLGKIYFNKANYSQAAEYYAKAVKAAPGSSDYRVRYGDALFKQGKYAEAKKQYAKAKAQGNKQADGRLDKVNKKLGG